MSQRTLEITACERRTCGVLIEHVGEHVELERLQRDGVSLAKASPLEEREVELPEQHRVCRSIERSPRREAAASMHRARTRRLRGHGLAEALFRFRPLLSHGLGKSVARTFFHGQNRPFLTWCFGRRNVLRVTALMRRLLSTAVVASLLILGCGRKATRADCETVVDRNVEVKLVADGVTDPATIAKRKDELRSSLKDDIDKCVGKRITDGMMECVKKATTPEQIDKCLR